MAAHPLGPSAAGARRLEANQLTKMNGKPALAQELERLIAAR